MEPSGLMLGTTHKVNSSLTSWATASSPAVQAQQPAQQPLGVEFHHGFFGVLAVDDPAGEGPGVDGDIVHLSSLEGISPWRPTRLSIFGVHEFERT